MAVLVLLLSGVQMLAVGALGEYVGRTYTEAQRRPLYFVASTTGFAEKDRTDTRAWRAALMNR